MIRRSPRTKKDDGSDMQWVINKRAKLRADYAADPEAEWRRRLMPKYGITSEQWDEMYNAQEGRCATCDTHQSKLKRRLNIDHDHSTGKVRGLLCDACNRALGHVNDSVDTLRRLINYLDTANASA